MEARNTAIPPSIIMLRAGIQPRFYNLPLLSISQLGVQIPQLTDFFVVHLTSNFQIFEKTF